MIDVAYAMSQPAQGAAGQPAPPAFFSFIPIIAIFAIFYFLVIMPQKKQQKEHKNMLEKIGKNDEVVTSGGIHGTVVNTDEKTVTLRVDDNTRIKFLKSAISFVKKK